MKKFDLTLLGVTAMVTESNLFNNELDKFNGIVSDAKLASHLAAITTSDKTSDALGIAKAFHAWSVTKEDAKREGYKTESELLMALTGLGKSSISQLRLVGGLFADVNGEFTVPEPLKGFTVGQIYEVLAKNKGIVSADDFGTIVTENGINCTTSAKDIRATFDGLTKEERAGVNKAKAVKAARNKLEKDGFTFPIYDQEGNEIMTVALIEVADNVSRETLEAVQNGDITVTIPTI